MIATSIATASEISAAHCAFIFRPPSSTNSVSSGSSREDGGPAERVRRPDRSTWVYMRLPPSLCSSRARLPDRIAIRKRRHGARSRSSSPASRHAVPAGRAGGGASCWSGSGTRWSSRRSRPAAGRCTSTPAIARGAGAGAPLRGRVRGREAVVTPSASCAAMVREQLQAAEIAAARVRAVGVRSSTELGVGGRGRHYPHRVTYHPTCHALRALRLGDAPLRLLRAVRGIDLVELPEARGVLRVRRDVRGQERRRRRRRCWPTSCATCSTRAPRSCCAADNSCLMHIGGGAVAHAHRCAHGAPRGDPGLDG